MRIHASDMNLTDFYSWHVNKIRDIKHQQKLEKYQRKSSQSNGTTIIIGSPAAIFGHMYGKGLADSFKQMKQKGLRESFTDLFRTLYPFFSYFLIVTILLSLTMFSAAVGWLVFSISPPDSQAYQLILPFIFGLPIIPYLHARYLSRSDWNVIKNVRSLSAEPSVENVDMAFDNISHRQHSARLPAIKAACSIVEQSPGKAVKYSAHSEEEICNRLIEQLQTQDREMTEYCLRCIDWLSRDYGHILMPHGKLFAGYIQSQHSQIQMSAISVIGNLPVEQASHVSACANAIKPAVTDADADVRYTAASVLGHLPCDESKQMLQHLLNDSAEEVRQQASVSMQQLAA